MQREVCFENHNALYSREGRESQATTWSRTSTQHTDWFAVSQKWTSLFTSNTTTFRATLLEKRSSSLGHLELRFVFDKAIFHIELSYMKTSLLMTSVEKERFLSGVFTHWAPERWSDTISEIYFSCCGSSIFWRHTNSQKKYLHNISVLLRWHAVFVRQAHWCNVRYHKASYCLVFTYRAKRLQIVYM